VDDLMYAVQPVRFAREVLGFDADEKQRLVLASNARRLLLCCTRQWGKSTVAAAAAVHRAYFYNESEIVVTSSSERQSAELVRKAKRFAAKLGLRLRGDGENQISLVFPNGSRIVGLPAQQKTIRGFSAVSLLLIDEAAQTPDEIYEAVKPMLATTDGSVWLMGTPYGKRGFFYEEWVRGGDQWLRVSVPATECPRIPARFLEEERESKGDRKFRQEYMCEFVQGDDALFREEDIRACLDEELEAIF
jgi:hypothetical protein